MCCSTFKVIYVSSNQPFFASINSFSAVLVRAQGRRSRVARGATGSPRISEIELCGAFKMCLIQSNSYSTCTSRILYLLPALETSRQLKWRIRFKNTVLLKVIDHRHRSPYRCSFHFAIANTVHTMAFLGNFFQ